MWPVRVTRPTRPPALVYLDLNHYIYLARAAAGDPTTPPGYDCLLTACRTSYDEGRVVFPLSGTHYVEMSGIQDPAQRQSVATVMERLSGFRVLLGRATIAELEIETMLDLLLEQATDGERFPLTGTSSLWAFGRRGGLNIVDRDGNDATTTSEVRWVPMPTTNCSIEINTFAERALLAGPSDNEIPALRAAGYKPESTRAITERRAEQNANRRLA